ncbi:MAG: hypothetical protein M3367_11330 [Acidobacteriota bacterium]|nr:hypothetical protein [Acidobacteriota bacterium]
MIENLPSYVSTAFILTTFLTVGFLFYAFRQTVSDTTAAKILFALVPLWLIFQAALASSGFYLSVDVFPPRLPFFAVIPAIVLIILLFIFARKNFISRLSIKTLTLLHVIRIPVEIVLLWLFQNGQVPQLMTFEGRNFDILSGLTAPIIAWLAFRNGKTNRPLLIVWNIFALLLLINIVTNAVLSIPSPFQQLAFEQPNRAVLYFPFVWLPSVVVPVALFCHLASLNKLFSIDFKS